MFLFSFPLCLYRVPPVLDATGYTVGRYWLHTLDATGYTVKPLLATHFGRYWLHVFFFIFQSHFGSCGHLFRALIIPHGSLVWFSEASKEVMFFESDLQFYFRHF
jgi:hypothetical protein